MSPGENRIRAKLVGRGSLTRRVIHTRQKKKKRILPIEKMALNRFPLITLIFCTRNLKFCSPDIF